MNLDKRAALDARAVLNIADRVLLQDRKTPGYIDLVEKKMDSLAETFYNKTPHRSVLKPVLIGVAIGLYVGRQQRLAREAYGQLRREDAEKTE